MWDGNTRQGNKYVWYKNRMPRLALCAAAVDAHARCVHDGREKAGWKFRFSHHRCGSTHKQVSGLIAKWFWPIGSGLFRASWMYGVDAAQISKNFQIFFRGTGDLTHAFTVRFASRSSQNKRHAGFGT